MSRIQNIITRIRTTLKDFTEDNIKDQTLLVHIENVSKDFLKRTECVEAVKDINVTSKGEVINVFGQSIKMPVIIKILNEDGVKIEYVDFSKFDLYRNASGNTIALYTVFGNIMFFAPKTAGSVKAYFYENNQVISDINSELVYPQDYDHIIALGVIAIYDSEYLSYYEQQINFVKDKSKIKTTELAVPTARW